MSVTDEIRTLQNEWRICPAHQHKFRVDEGCPSCAMYLEHIRETYDVPAHFGMRIHDYKGRLGTIVGANGSAHLLVILDEDDTSYRVYHPEWRIEYESDETGDTP